MALWIGELPIIWDLSEQVETFNKYQVHLPLRPIVEMRGASRAIMPLWKRILDLVLVLASAPVAIFLGLVIWLVIKVGSRGPVIFRQERLGYKGRAFTCFKFRTMYVGADTCSHQGHMAQLMKKSIPMTKLDATRDSRIIPFGGVLRSTGLDELPQLINVLRGDMSLVGPRPCVRYEYERYEPWQRRRFDAVPGLTGLWQVSGKNRLTFKQMVKLDIEYSERTSLWLDFKIIFKTIPALIAQCCDQRKQRKQLARQPRAISDAQAGVRIPAEVNAVN